MTSPRARRAPRPSVVSLCCLLFFMLVGCGGAESARLARDTGAKTRVFDTPDRTRMLEAVVGALHELGFAIDAVDLSSGKVNASTSGDYQLNMVVNVEPSGDKRQMLVGLEAYLFYDPVPLTHYRIHRIFFEELSAASELEPRGMCSVSVPPEGVVKEICGDWLFSRWLVL